MSTSKGKPYHHGDLRDALINLAVEALEREGPEALSLRGLATRAGVSGMAPYRHFADKAALLAAAARRGFADLRERLAFVDDPTEPKKALVAFGVVYVRFACERPGLFRLMFAGPPPTADEELTADPQTVIGLFGARLADLVPPDRRHVAFVAAWSAMHGLASLVLAGRMRGPAPHPIELAEQVGKVIIAGLSASQPAPESGFRSH
jgi:AcrR family transcriptional regulator